MTPAHGSVPDDSLPPRLEGLPYEAWIPKSMSVVRGSTRVNSHAHHDTNPWGWDGLRVLRELWRRGVRLASIVAFDSGRFIDSVADAARYAGEHVPGFIEVLILTPGGTVWNDLPGRMYVQAGPFDSTSDANALTTRLTELARRRAEYQAGAWNEHIDLGFTYTPNWDRLVERGITEANLARDLVEAVDAMSPHPDDVWTSVPGLTLAPTDPNFARDVRSATMVRADAPASVPRTSEYYLDTPTFIELAGDRAWYMYVGKNVGEEANRASLLDAIRQCGFAGICAIPQRNVDTPEHARDFEAFLTLVRDRKIPLLFGTELNAHGQWWDVDLADPDFSATRAWIEATWREHVMERRRSVRPTA